MSSRNKTAKKSKSKSPKKISPNTAAKIIQKFAKNKRRSYKSRSASKVAKLPKIITIGIFSHGTDLVDIPFNDPGVRILSMAGNLGSISWGIENGINYINDNINDDREYYFTKMRELGYKTRQDIRNFESSVAPGANMCKNMPTLLHDKTTNSFTPQSSYNYIKKIAKFPKVTNFFKNEHDDELDVSLTKIKMTDMQREWTMNDAKTKQIGKIYTPVINKGYYGNDIEMIRSHKREKKRRGSLFTKPSFGVYVLDLCNYNGDVKIRDELMSCKKEYNLPFYNMIHDPNPRTIGSYTFNDGQFDLESLVNYLHELSFDIINIIDLSCRECSIEDRELRDRIVAEENEKASLINTQI